MSSRIRTRGAAPAIEDFEGELIVPGDASYDAARTVENAAIDRHPALIARCTSAADIAAALAHARRRGLAPTVRGGGHGRDGFAVADGRLAIDLTPMQAVAVDPQRRRARVQGGATWRVLDAATQAHGLAMTGARVPSVGVAGFTLGSGSGWLERKHGLAADSLRSALVVTAAGDLVRASADSHPDLFWALRGGGPSFGVVAELEFDLHPVAGVVSGMLAWPAARAAEIGDAYARLIAGADDDLGGAVAVFNAPPLPFVPAGLHGTPMVGVVVLWTGAEHEAAAAIAPLRAAAPAVDAVGPSPYAALQGMFEAPGPVRARVHGEGGFLTDISGELVAALADWHRHKPAPHGSLLLQPLGGAFARVPAGATPLGRRDAGWAWQAGAAWADPGSDDAVAGWMAGVRAILAGRSAGEPYPNFIPAVDPARLRRSYGETAWRRLQDARASWDPDGVFTAGHAIPLA